MDKNIRIFHSAYSVYGRSKFNSARSTTIEGLCTFVCRRSSDSTLEVAVSFCHQNDTFRKKTGVATAFEHLNSGNFITIPVSRSVTGRALNDVVRDFFCRAGSNDFRHVCFGTPSNIPVKDWEYVHIFPRFTDLHLDADE